jgi:hypothetical protein
LPLFGLPALSFDANADTAKVLAGFEAWYAATRPVPLWALFENVMPETPVVDF